MTDTIPSRDEGFWQLFSRFFKFGLLAWGGPAAQIEMIKRECVDHERWITQESFKKTLAVYQILPGPEAHEMCVYFGRLRGGKLGAFAAGLGFMLPGFALMLALSVLYVEADLADDLDELFYGLKAAVGAIVSRAVVRLSRSFVTDVPLALIAVSTFGLTIGVQLGFVFALLGGGVAYELWTNANRWVERANSLTLEPAFAAVALAGISLPLAGEIFSAGLQTGLVTFGGAFTAVPFLHDLAVEGQDWLTEGQFLDGLAISGALPAPLIIFATFVGYIAGGMVGAILITLGVFLPAFVLPIFFHRQLHGIAENARIRPFLLGVAAAVIGLIAAVAIQIVDQGVVDGWTAALALLAFAALSRWHGKLTVLYVVLGCGLTGALLQVAALA